MTRERLHEIQSELRCANTWAEVDGVGLSEIKEIVRLADQLLTAREKSRDRVAKTRERAKKQHRGPYNALTERQSATLQKVIDASPKAAGDALRSRLDPDQARHLSPQFKTK